MEHSGGSPAALAASWRLAGRARVSAAAAAATPAPEPADGRLGDGEGALDRSCLAGLRRGRRRPIPDVRLGHAVRGRDRLQGHGPGRSATSDEAFSCSSTNPEQFDVISASGDASLRLVRGGYVAAGQRRPVPNYADIFPALKDKPYNTVDGVHYGVPHGRGSNLLMWRTDERHAGPDELGRRCSTRRRRSPARSRSTTRRSTSPTRRSYLMKTKPELGIKNPYALDDTQFAGGGRPAEAAEADDRPVLGRLHEADGRVPQRRRDRRHDVAGHHEPAPGRDAGQYRSTSSSRQRARRAGPTPG